MLAITGLDSLSSLFRFDALTGVMLALVACIGVVIVRYSQRYLSGQPGVARYRRWLAATLASTAILVSANHLLLLAAAWTVSGLCLHQLLTFFTTRPQALIAAHKKFLLSRIADLFIFGGVIVLGRAADTMFIDALVQRAAQWQSIAPSLPWGAVLLACGVIIRSAQLPFHGWLIQVMEAPTPVSALLHAGIVNMGGFVMIRLAGVMTHMEYAQLLLVVVGATTAVLAGLVMMTRVSVKVALAWSTCAQMGFMLLECGLGAYPLALLHLVAHSLYKAHAFLSSGNRVNDAVRARMAGPVVPTSPWRLAWGVLVGLVIVATVGALAIPPALRHPSTAVSALILALAVAPLLARRSSSSVVARRVLQSVAGVALFAVWYRLFAELVPTAEVLTAGLLVRCTVAAVLFASLFIVQSIIVSKPTGALARRLYPHFLAGFYLDEFITFLTFRVWPPRVPRSKAVAMRSAASPVLQERIA